MTQSAYSAEMAEAFRRREAAVLNKRLARKYSRTAKRQMEELRAFCEAHGIALEIVTGKGMDSGNEKDG